jgi:hypothetical protein
MLSAGKFSHRAREIGAAGEYKMPDNKTLLALLAFAVGGYYFLTWKTQPTAQPFRPVQGPSQPIPLPTPPPRGIDPRAYPSGDTEPDIELDRGGEYDPNTYDQGLRSSHGYSESEVQDYGTGYINDNWSK